MDIEAQTYRRFLGVLQSYLVQLVAVVVLVVFQGVSVVMVVVDHGYC